MGVEALLDSQNGVGHANSEDHAWVHVFGQDRWLSGGGGELEDSVFDGLGINVVVGTLAELRPDEAAELRLKIGSRQNVIAKVFGRRRGFLFG